MSEITSREKALLKAIAGETKRFVAEQLGPLRERILALEAELAIERGKAYVRFAGTWRPGVIYHKGDAVGRHGLWVCLVDSTSLPPGGSTGAADWQLCVKESKDAR